jgi:DNA replication and repair protein RecF
VWISQLDLTQWRNHEHTRLVCEPGVTVLVGPNGQGKTNIVEAIRYFATLGSHRVPHTASLIKDEADSATIFAHLHHGEREITAGITLRRQGTNDATLNGAKAKVAEIPRWVSVVMFSPEDSAIIRGEPTYRRGFMDELVLSGSPSMAAVFSDFERVLKQRNSLLKSLRSNHRPADLSTLDSWTERFATAASEIVTRRVSQLRDIMPHVASHYDTLAGGDQVHAWYQPKGYELDSENLTSAVVSQRITTALEVVRRAELERGMTLVGPHRDDVEFTIESKPARTHASQGETWSFALALRLGMAAWVRTQRASGDPIMILDDVFAELDATRRAQLVGAIADYEQLLVTSAVEEDLPQGLEGRRFDVHQGVVSVR